MREIFNTIFNAGKTKEAPKEKEHEEHDTNKQEQKESGTKHATQENGDGQEQKAAGV